LKASCASASFFGWKGRAFWRETPEHPPHARRVVGLAVLRLQPAAEVGARPGTTAAHVGVRPALHRRRESGLLPCIHLGRCGDCGHAEIAYNSCRNRHCPKCQGAARAAWVAARRAELLPVPYFHVVFTLPAAVGAIPFQNEAVVYGILFRAAAETLRIIAVDPRHLGAEIGGVAVLHSWGQTMQHHPHVHCIVPGGGLAPDGAHWIACPPRFFLSVKVLGRLFRRLFLERLAHAFNAGALHFLGELAPLASAERFAAHCAMLRGLDWVVYAKRPFGGPEQVLAYLGRYTHRVAIANSRLIAMADGRVSSSWKDYRHEGRNKLMTLDATEFSAGSFSTSCRTASTASGTSASWPTVIAPPASPAGDAGRRSRSQWTSEASTRQRPLRPTALRPATTATPAPAAAALCARSRHCPGRRPSPRRGDDDDDTRSPHHRPRGSVAPPPCAP
jgi:hypothetical protein